MRPLPDPKARRGPVLRPSLSGAEVNPTPRLVAGRIAGRSDLSRRATGTLLLRLRNGLLDTQGRNVRYCGCNFHYEPEAATV